MEQLNNFADNRLIDGCIYCGGSADTRDHVPSKCLLEQPFPDNLPVVGCCYSCNQDFSKDEQYFVCLIESVLCGSTDPAKMERPSVARMMQNSPKLRQRIEISKIEVDSQITFVPEIERIVRQRYGQFVGFLCFPRIFAAKMQKNRYKSHKGLVCIFNSDFISYKQVG